MKINVSFGFYLKEKVKDFWQAKGGVNRPSPSFSGTRRAGNDGYWNSFILVRRWKREAESPKKEVFFGKREREIPLRNT